MAFESLARGLPLAILLPSVIAVPMLLLEPGGLPRLRSLQRDLGALDRSNAEARREIERLRSEVKQLRESPAALEKIARDSLGLVRKNEVVFQFDPR